MRKPKSLLSYTALPNELALDRLASNQDGAGSMLARNANAGHSVASLAQAQRSFKRSSGHPPPRRLYQRHR
jgi:hypothetical protein